MNITRDFNPDLTRYDFDDTLLTLGFLQVDTNQDFSHYGNWVHLDNLWFRQFAEGDITVISFDSDEEMTSYLRNVYGLLHIDLGLKNREHRQVRAKELGIEDITA